MRESNPRHRFWRPKLCHLTNHPYIHTKEREKSYRNLFLDFFMLGLFSAPFAEFFKLDFLGDKLFVFTGPVIDALADRAGKFYKSILGHMCILV